MRMRRKKNLEEKLLECSDILLSPVTDDRNYNTAVDKKEYFDYFLFRRFYNLNLFNSFSDLEHEFEKRKRYNKSVAKKIKYMVICSCLKALPCEITAQVVAFPCFPLKFEV